MEVVPPLRIGALGVAKVTPLALLEPAKHIAGVVVVAVAARNRVRAARFAREHGIALVHDDYAALIADPNVDAVYVALPNSLHAEWAVRALRAGKHVLCEKPIASNACEAAVMASTAREMGCVLAEAFHYRHHPLAHRIETLVRGGALGGIQRIEGRFEAAIPRNDPVRWSFELAGGATMDLGCYPLQMMCWLGGGEPEVVSAEAVTGPTGVDAAMVARLRLPGGGSAEMRCAMGDEISLHTSLLVRGSHGVLEVENPVAPHLGHRLRLTVGAVVHDEMVPGDTSYACQLRDFAAAVRFGNPMPVDGNAAVSNMRLIDAVYRAAGLPVRGS